MERNTLSTFAAIAAICVGATLFTQRSSADAQPGRYVIKLETVYDTRTKLTWQHDAVTTPYTWADAKTYCDTLKSSGLNWRLPSVKELETLVDESVVNPSIDHAAFPDTPGKYFWTSSIVKNFETNGWTVDFNRGGDNFFPLTSTQLIRCVH